MDIRDNRQPQPCRSGACSAPPHRPPPPLSDNSIASRRATFTYDASTPLHLSPRISTQPRRKLRGGLPLHLSYASVIRIARPVVIAVSTCCRGVRWVNTRGPVVILAKSFQRNITLRLPCYSQNHSNEISLRAFTHGGCPSSSVCGDWMPSECTSNAPTPNHTRRLLGAMCNVRHCMCTEHANVMCFWRARRLLARHCQTVSPGGEEQADERSK
jgi:hypothetical protein